MKKEENPIPCIKGIAERLRHRRLSRLIVALSGGADSVALLRMLLEAATITPLELKAVHCDFHLRGEESLRDERFCRDLCGRLGVKLECVDFNAAEYAQARNISIETACRELRYDFFFSLMEREGWQRVVTAHHADDNAETLLLNLMRGSGLHGLKGMVEDTGRVFRPLLEETRASLRHYLANIGQNFVEDSSNGSSDYRRNFLRREVIPLLQTRWPAASRSIARSASILAREMLLAYPEADRDAATLSRETIMASPDPNSRVFSFIRRAGGTPVMAREMAESILRHDSAAASGRWWRLPSGSRVSLERDCLEILPERCSLAEISCEAVPLSEEVWQEILSERDPAVAWLPAPLSSYIVRRAEEGDRLRPLGLKGSVKVSKLMKDARFTRRSKEQTPVVVERLSGDGQRIDGHTADAVPGHEKEGAIIWVAGLRRGAAAMVPRNATVAFRCRLSPAPGAPIDPPPFGRQSKDNP